jgi:type IV secretory pathway VirB3-like protein
MQCGKVKTCLQKSGGGNKEMSFLPGIAIVIISISISSFFSAPVFPCFWYVDEQQCFRDEMLFLVGR